MAVDPYELTLEAPGKNALGVALMRHIVEEFAGHDDTRVVLDDLVTEPGVDWRISGWTRGPSSPHTRCAAGRRLQSPTRPVS